VCTGQFGNDQVNPLFDVSVANDYYQEKYSITQPLITKSLNWFPQIPTRGHGGISYAILKKLPCIHHILATLYNKLLIHPVPPSTWTSSKITLIYKKGEASQAQNFRMIALSCTMGKIYHQLMANRTVNYMMLNKFIDPAIQKAFIKKVNGTIEHNILLHEIIDHAKANNKTVDLEDAFGSVSH
jgi:hypothetical protein